MTETSGGSDLAAVKTTAKKDGDDWILNGSKVFITNGVSADLVVVAARTNFDVQPAHGISLFLVHRREHAGMTESNPLKKVGQKTSDTGQIFLDNVRLPNTALLGPVQLYFE